MKRYRRRYCPNRKRYRGERGTGGAWKVILLLVIVGAMLFWLEGQLKPVLKTLTENEAKAAAVTAINEAVSEKLSRSGIDYESLVQVERSENGQIQAIVSNTSEMNRLKTEISESLQEAMRNDHLKVGIPIGTLMKSEFLHGRGPEVPLVVTLAGNIDTEFESDFQSAGINQTRHRILMTIHTSIFSFLPGMSEGTEVETSIVVAETVIVGEVPEMYAQVTPDLLYNGSAANGFK